MRKWLGHLAKLKKPVLNYKKTSITALVILVLVGGIMIFVHALNAPAIGSLNQTPPAKAEVVDPYAEPGNYKGKYISFTYPTHYRTLSAKKTGSSLEVANFYSTDHTSKQISIEVVPSGVAEESINYRKAHPETYIADGRTRDGQSFTIRTNGSERTIFINHGENAVTISVSTPNSADVSVDAQFIASSLRWLK